MAVKLNVRVTLDAEGTIRIVPLDAAAMQVMQDIRRTRVGFEYTGHWPDMVLRALHLAVDVDGRPTITDDGTQRTRRVLTHAEHAACKKAIERVRKALAPKPEPRKKKGKSNG